MPRRAREVSRTGYYHVIMRGNNKKYIFEGEEDKNYFMKNLMQMTDCLSLAAWCLMDNHVHLILKSNLDELSAAIKKVNVKFAMMYHSKHGTVGHVFQDRFKSQTIESDKNLLSAIRYVHNNPVKAKIVSRPEDYKWSSYNHYLSQKNVTEPMKIVMGILNHSIPSFQAYHKMDDRVVHMDIKEEKDQINKEKLIEEIHKIQEKYGYKEIEELKGSKESIIEVIRNLDYNNNGISLRQIGQELNIPYTTLYRYSKVTTDTDEPI